MQQKILQMKNYIQSIEKEHTPVDNQGKLRPKLYYKCRDYIFLFITLSLFIIASLLLIVCAVEYYRQLYYGHYNHNINNSHNALKGSSGYPPNVFADGFGIKDDIWPEKDK